MLVNRYSSAVNGNPLTGLPVYGKPTRDSAASSIALTVPAAANAPSAFRGTATSSSSQGGREDERRGPSIRFSHLRRILREVKMRGCPLGG